MGISLESGAEMWDSPYGCFISSLRICLMLLIRGIVDGLELVVRLMMSDHVSHGESSGGWVLSWCAVVRVGRGGILV